METIEIIIAINDNSPWSNYASRAISAQKLHSAEIIKISIVTQKLEEESVLQFKQGLDPSLLELVETIECPPFSQGIEMSILGKSSIADYVCFTTGYSYWINEDKLESQVTNLASHNDSYSWHTVLVRSQEVQQVFPKIHSKTEQLDFTTYDIPWVSLMFPTRLLSSFDGSQEAINLIGLISHLKTNFKGRLIIEPLSIIQNSAGRGPLALNLWDFAISQRHWGNANINWMKLLENGTLSNSHIEDVILNYKHKTKSSSQDKIRYLMFKTKKMMSNQFSRIRRKIHG